MINDSADPILITDSPYRAVKSAIVDFGSFLRETIGEEDRVSRGQRRYFRVLEMFHPNLLAASIDQDFLSALNEICVRNQNAYPEGLLDRVYSGTSSSKKLSADKLRYLRSLARFVLYRLWSEGHLVLPITFKLSGSFDRSELSSVAPETARFCNSFPKQNAKGSTYYRMTQHAPRFLTCTSWLTPEAIDINEAVSLNRFLLMCMNGTAGFPAPTITLCVRIFLAEALKHFGPRVSYNWEDLSNFDLLFKSHAYDQTSISEVVAFVEERSRRRRREAKRRARGTHALTNKRQRLEEPQTANFTTSRGNDQEDDAFRLVYKSRYGRVGWFLDTSELSFLERRLPTEAICRWSTLFDGYTDFRINIEQLESHKVTQTAIRVLSDYLAVCLPVYFDKAANDRRYDRESDVPDHKVGVTVLEKFPLAPMEFTRFPFVDKRGDKDFGAPTLLEYVSQRYKSRASRYGILNQIWLFFSYVEQNYGDALSADIAGPEFRNPISKQFDLPRQQGRKARKTDKKPFAKHVIPHFLSWLYAVEAFGIYLQKARCSVPARSSVLSTSAFGYVPFYRHLGRIHQIESVPSGLLPPVPGTNIPSLAYVRMFIAPLETGLRLQHIQWLCRLSFDKLNDDKRESDIFRLWVNTDKNRNGFPVPILDRVRQLLLREKEFQESLQVTDEWICYEGRTHTRFEKLVPLFRNPKTHRPYSDTSYRRAWLVTLEAFQNYFEERVGLVEFVRLGRPENIAIEHTKDGHEFCPLSLEAVYTPHSCRSTFVTRRSHFVDLADIAIAVGHANQIVTAHYDYPEYDALAAKLKDADGEIWAEAQDRASVASGPAFIKAAEQNSALRASFRADRKATMDSFGIISLSSALDDDSNSGVELLQASPLSQAVFRDSHICPVGEYCPPEVVEAIGERRRCGLCFLSCSSVDHLPAIAARIRHLYERIEASKKVYWRRQKRNATQAELGEIYDLIDADTQELLAWKLKEEILWDIRKRFPDNGSDHIHVEEPEIVRKHLRRVVKASSEQEFLLNRIVESNEYPTLATDYLRFRANKLKRRIMGDDGASDNLFSDEEIDDIEVLASFIVTTMKAKSLSLEELAEVLGRPSLARKKEDALLFDNSRTVAS